MNSVGKHPGPAVRSGFVLAAVCAAVLACGTACRSGGPPPPDDLGLSPAQLDTARATIAVGQARHEPAEVIRANLADTAAESGFRNYANPRVPESMRLPHDAVGASYDSVGTHQLRAGVWAQRAGGINHLMDPAWQAGWFYDHAAQVPGYRSLSAAQLAAAVAKSPTVASDRATDLADRLYRKYGGEQR